jgi:hypothetical protein
MSTESQLREKPRKIEALFAGAGTMATIGGGGGAGTGAGASHQTRSQGCSCRDAILDARPVVAPSISRVMPALRVEPLSFSSATAHRHGPGAARLRRSGSLARVRPSSSVSLALRCVQPQAERGPDRQSQSESGQALSQWAFSAILIMGSRGIFLRPRGSRATRPAIKSRPRCSGATTPAMKRRTHSPSRLTSSG